MTGGHRLAAALVLALALVVAGDATTRVHDLGREIPGLDLRFARHLLFDDDPTFRRYCRDVGMTELKAATYLLQTLMLSGDRTTNARNFRQLSPYQRRIAGAIASEYDSPEHLDDLRILEELGERRYDVVLALRTLNQLQSGGAPPTPAKFERYRSLITEFDSLGYQRGALYAEGALAREVASAGRVAEREALLNRALDRSRRIGDHLMICQYLGEIGFGHRLAGQTDSMFACYLEGIAVADRHRIPEQASRLRLFLASYYAAEGRLAVATDLMRRAQSVCREYGGGPLELRAVLQSMDQFAELGCWDIVDQLSHRVPVLLRAMPHTMHGDQALTYGLEPRLWEARLLAARGQPSAAATRFASLAPTVRQVRGREGYGDVLAEQADALLACGRPREALTTIRRGLGYADSVHLPAIASGLALAQVRAQLALGDPGAATAALLESRMRSAADPSDPPDRRFLQAALAARIALGAGRREQARRTVEQAWIEFRDHVAALEPGPQSSLALAKLDELRSVGHEVLTGQPAAACAWELEWRAQAARFGRADDGEWNHAVVARGPPALASMPGTVRLVYAMTPAGLTRWTVLSGQVRQDVLAIDAEQCARTVENLVTQVSRDPDTEDAHFPASLRDTCVLLGRELLPDTLRSLPRSRVLVSAEGELARLPFEILDAGDGNGYQPLLARHDVAYARPAPRIVRRPGDGTTVVLTDADVPPGSAMSGGLGRLKWVAEEAAEIGERMPRARVVRSTDVSKQDVLTAWSHASVLYVAAHLTRDPEAPLVCYFPMTFGARQHRLDDSYLDLRDVLSLDLSGCDLAVLSSCASGEPYVVGGWAGPSMADAMLDAGARAAICTRWQVRDDRARVVAPRLAIAWTRGPGDPLARWCDVRRTMLRDRQGWRHPFEWAAWSVTIRDERPEPAFTRPPVTAAAMRSAPARHAPPAESPARSR
jgi:tetratricopeptide (TPR) repeat protein